MVRRNDRNLPVRTRERLPSLFDTDFGFAPFDSPWRLMRRMRDEFDRMLAGFGFGPSLGIESWRPTMDVFETDKEVVVRADVPGIEPSDVEVVATEDSLTLRGEVKDERQTDDRGYYYAERRVGAFERTISLPTEVVPDKAKATFKHGVVEIHLPKVAEAKSRAKKITVTEEPEKTESSKK